jgi:hypothetical protein
MSGGWSFLHVCIEATGAEYIIVDEMHLASGDCWEAMLEGNMQVSPYATGAVKSGVLSLRLTRSAAAKVIADTTQVFKRGDTIEYIDPVAGGREGVARTDAGWREYGDISLM